LVNKVADIYGAHMGVKLNPLTEVLGTLGANGSLHSFIQGWLNPGDELVTFEPMFPMYLDHIEMSGGRLRAVPLNYSDKEWMFNPGELRKALSAPNVKVFIFNSPHNPTGKVFSLEEMQLISDILDEFPHIKVISDEVYNFLTFDKLKHQFFAKVGNNWDRTVTVFSGGKLFNCTGWKVGWAIGPQPLIHLGAVISNTVYYCFNHPGQVGMAACLEKAYEPNYK
jgi:aspartate/methionine/tyrosine aminotransferase